MNKFTKTAFFVSAIMAFGAACASTGHLHYTINQLKQNANLSSFNFHVSNNSNDATLDAIKNELNLPSSINPQQNANSSFSLPTTSFLGTTIYFVEKQNESNTICRVIMDFDPTSGLDLSTAPNDATCNLTQGTHSATVNVNSPK